MPLPVIDECFRVTLNWEDSNVGSPAANVIHFQGGALSPEELMALLNDHVNTDMWNYCRDTSSISVVDITPLDGVSATQSFPTGSPAEWAGSGSTGDRIVQACALVKLTTALRGRSYRGRIYLPWVVETATTNGDLNSANVDAVTDGWQTFKAAMDTAAAPLVVASYVHATAQIVETIGCETRLATQRKRLHR
jgi:hypothetical protein